MNSFLLVLITLLIGPAYSQTTTPIPPFIRYGMKYEFLLNIVGEKGYNGFTDSFNKKCLPKVSIKKMNFMEITNLLHLKNVKDPHYSIICDLPDPHIKCILSSPEMVTYIEGFTSNRGFSHFLQEEYKITERQADDIIRFYKDLIKLRGK